MDISIESLTRYPISLPHPPTQLHRGDLKGQEKINDSSWAKSIQEKMPHLYPAYCITLAGRVASKTHYNKLHKRDVMFARNIHSKLSSLPLDLPVCA